jgi:hypothetical protein
MSNLLKVLDLFYKTAAEELSIKSGNILLYNSIGQAINKLNEEKHSDLKKGLYTLLRKFETFVKNDSKVPAVSLKNPLKITFFQQPQDDENILEESIDLKQRAITTLGKYIRRSFIKSLNEKEKEKAEKFFTDNFLDYFVKLVNEIIYENIEALDVEIDSEKGGEDLTEAYRESEAKSCMSGGKCINMDLLAKNPDKVSLVTYKNEARALLWTTDSGEKVLDRIYPESSKYILPLRQWAKDKGYILRNNADGLETGYIGLSDDKDYTVTLDMTDIKRFPYLDTFKYGKVIKEEDDVKKLVLSNNDEFGEIEFSQTSGVFPEGEEENCAGCGNIIDEGDYNIETEDGTMCGSCAENYHRCEGCNDIVHMNNMFGLDDSIYCEDCYNAISVQCAGCEDIINEYSATEVEGNYYCDDCLENVPRCEECGEYMSNHGICPTCLDEEKKSKQLRLPYSEDDVEINKEIVNAFLNIAKIIINSEAMV